MHGCLAIGPPPKLAHLYNVHVQSTLSSASSYANARSERFQNEIQHEVAILYNNTTQAVAPLPRGSPFLSLTVHDHVEAPNESNGGHTQDLSFFSIVT